MNFFIVRQWNKSNDRIKKSFIFFVFKNSFSFKFILITSLHIVMTNQIFIKYDVVIFNSIDYIIYIFNQIENFVTKYAIQQKIVNQLINFRQFLSDQITNFVIYVFVNKTWIDLIIEKKLKRNNHFSKSLLLKLNTIEIVLKKLNKQFEINEKNIQI